MYYYPINVGGRKLETIKEKEFLSAAIVFHPFFKIPKNLIKGEYPSIQEIVEEAESISWKDVMKQIEFNSYKELTLALDGYYWGFPKDDKQKFLLEYLVERLPQDTYIPYEDMISPFILQSFISYLKQRGDNMMNYQVFHDEKPTEVDLNQVDINIIRDICEQPTTVISIDGNIALTCYFDSSYSLLLSKENNIEQLVESMNVESMVCDETMTSDWFFR